ncbi:hypothetical protein EVAR_75543_1 [Eumeta japonica]|uniref:Uncharacterized protein n=1 Tax=Eumeta variegata TaxID=151549 RepID=A0A4C1UIV7_EUMVA|nr:hypothetical protein EVAR_75543_1 [Eumeta japonica]
MPSVRDCPMDAARWASRHRKSPSRVPGARGRTGWNSYSSMFTVVMGLQITRARRFISFDEGGGRRAAGGGRLMRGRGPPAPTTLYLTVAQKDKAYVQRLKDQSKKQANRMSSSFKTSGKAQKASYVIANILVKAKKPHFLAET